VWSAVTHPWMAPGFAALTGAQALIIAFWVRLGHGHASAKPIVGFMALGYIAFAYLGFAGSRNARRRAFLDPLHRGPRNPQPNSAARAATSLPAPGAFRLTDLAWASVRECHPTESGGVS
jgi:hypothetical protein